jgi:hypothetical protein
MSKEENRSDSTEQGQRPRYQVRLPGFIPDEAIGLGDVLKRATYAMGVKPCGGCERRAAALNRWVGFSGRSRQSTTS